MPTAPAVDRESVPIATVGAAALSVLHAHERGRVLAVFRRSFYVAFDNEVVCVGPLELGLGPLVALYARRNRLAWPHRGLDVGADVTRDGDTLSVGPGLRFDFGAVDPWQPPAAPPHSPATMRLGLQRLAVAARRRSPGGLGALLPALCAATRPDAQRSSDAVLRAAVPVVCTLRDWLIAAFTGSLAAPPAVAALIGLGGGLTPSGDDFLGGMMTALHHLGHGELARALAKPVLACAPDGTSVISGAYLRCAAAGQGFKVLFDAINCLLAGGDAAKLDMQLDAVAEVGHTSGWDFLAGAACVCAALAHARAGTDA
jgi:hypothetical protein